MEINRFGQLINNILELIGKKQEDNSEKIEMLRKVEERLLFLVEARDHIMLIKKDDTTALEIKLRMKHRGDNLKK